MLSTVSAASGQQMPCLMPGAAVGRSLHAHVIYRGGGRKGDMFSRKEFVFLSRFSFCRLKKKREKKST